MADRHGSRERPRGIDLMGRRFGRLVVVERVSQGEWGKGTRWRCLCDCGHVAFVRPANLRKGHTKSCGCLVRENGSVPGRRIYRVGGPRKTHGMCGTPEYKAWQCMINRCERPWHRDYPRWGGRGIRVCEAWRESFEAFYKDVGPRPGSRYSLDRYPDNNGNYEPGNVAWRTVEQQHRNTRTNRLVTFKGQTKCVAAWAEELGMGWWTLYQRLWRSGWDVERAFTTPVKGKAAPGEV